MVVHFYRWIHMNLCLNREHESKSSVAEFYFCMKSWNLITCTLSFLFMSFITGLFVHHTDTRRLHLGSWGFFWSSGSILCWGQWNKLGPYREVSQIHKVWSESNWQNFLPIFWQGCFQRLEGLKLTLSRQRYKGAIDSPNYSSWSPLILAHIQDGH